MKDILIFIMTQTIILVWAKVILSSKGQQIVENQPIYKYKETIITTYEDGKPHKHKRNRYKRH